MKSHPIRVLADVNPQLAIWRQRGARAALVDSTWMTVGACKRQNIQTHMFKYEQMNGVRPFSRRLATCHLNGVGFNIHRFSSEASLDKAVDGSTDMVMYS